MSKFTLDDYKQDKAFTEKLSRILAGSVGQFLREQGNRPGLNMSAAKAMILNSAVLIGHVCGTDDPEFVHSLATEMAETAKQYCLHHMGGDDGE